MLEWILANGLLLNVLNETYSFYTVPWVLWNVKFGIFLSKLFTAQEDDDGSGAPPPDDTNGRPTRSRDRRIYLVRNGPYSIIRHPIYCGLLLEALGSNVIGGFASWVALVSRLPTSFS